MQSLVHGRRIAKTELTEDPIFVVGHWQSGTTLVHELLACDPTGQMRTVCQCFGLDRFDQMLPALREYVAGTADYQTNRYEISPETRDRITSRWISYIEKYGYDAPEAAGREGGRARGVRVDERRGPTAKQPSA